MMPKGFGDGKMYCQRCRKISVSVPAVRTACCVPCMTRRPAVRRAELARWAKSPLEKAAIESALEKAAKAEARRQKQIADRTRKAYQV